MSDNELLLAISNMMDKKLKPVNDRLEKIENTQKNDILPRLDKLESAQKRTELAQKKMELALKKMALIQENDILPRLQNIEECYISTYERYQSGAMQIEAMQSDIDVIKKVVTGHSGKLQKFA